MSGSYRCGGHDPKIKFEKRDGTLRWDIRVLIYDAIVEIQYVEIQYVGYSSTSFTFSFGKK